MGTSIVKKKGGVKKKAGNALTVQFIIFPVLSRVPVVIRIINAEG